MKKKTENLWTMPELRSRKRSIMFIACLPIRILTPGGPGSFVCFVLFSLAYSKGPKIVLGT